MNAPKSHPKSYTLLGLLVAFLLSAVVGPAISFTPEFNNSITPHFTDGEDSHSTPASPLPFPEEEKEEENSDKNHSFDFALTHAVYEQVSPKESGPTTWEFNHTNATALTNLPLYLAKQSLLV